MKEVEKQYKVIPNLAEKKLTKEETIEIIKDLEEAKMEALMKVSAGVQLKQIDPR